MLCVATNQPTGHAVATDMGQGHGLPRLMCKQLEVDVATGLVTDNRNHSLSESTTWWFKHVVSSMMFPNSWDGWLIY